MKLEKIVISAVAALGIASALATSFQDQIEACAARGGGRVVIPAGTWETGPIHLRSNVELHFEDGATLVFSGDPADYRPLVRTSFACIECLGLSPLIYAYGCTNVAVTGKGTLRPRMETWKVWFNRNTPEMFAAMKQLYAWGENDEPVENRRAPDLPGARFRPCFVEFNRCASVRLADFAVRESPLWTVHLYLCENVHVRGLDLQARGHNNDGIDVDSSRRVLIEDCTFDQGDDGIVIKSGRDRDGRRIGVPCEDVEVRNCTANGGPAFLTIGSEVSGGVRNIRFHDCRATAPVQTLVSLKTSERKGGFIENIVVSNISAKAVRGDVVRLLPNIDFQWGKYPAREKVLTKISDIRVENVRCERAAQVYSLAGDARLPARNITLRNIRVDSVDRRIGTQENIEGFAAENIEGKVSDFYPRGVAERVEALARPVLGPGESLACWSSFYNRLFDLDVEADEAWLKQKDAAAFDARREKLREKMISLIGGFPAKTPLRARITGTIRRSGYSIEKILFESRPGMFVTGNLYLPDPVRFPPPHPAALEVCGHSGNGKNSTTYQRIAVLNARNGIAALVIDPLGQGERRQCDEEKAESGSPTRNHLRMGVNALLLGHNFAAFELWDAIRALDYLDTRADLRHDGYGVMGNSGGGTQSVLLSAVEPRIKATATSCFLCNLREQTMWRLLPDCEQIIFGQLPAGINHGSYPLLGGNPVLMLARRDDIIPFSGTRATARLLAQVGANIGRPDHYAMYDLPGPHGYTERHMRATATFFAKRFLGREAVFPEAELDVANHDNGPDEHELLVTPNGQVSELAGFRSVYDYLNDELETALTNRTTLTREERAALVRRLADIDPSRSGARTVASDIQHTDAGCRLSDGSLVVRTFYESADGYRMPVVELIPPEQPVVSGYSTYQPLLLVADTSRTNCAELAMANRPRLIFVADVCGCGEIGATRHHYINPNDDEETAKMLYLLGSSLVGRQAGEMIRLGLELRKRAGRPPTIVAFGRACVAAAHAQAAAPGLFTDFEYHDPPPSWAKAIRTRALTDYSTSVPGALLHYDWTDL